MQTDPLASALAELLKQTPTALLLALILLKFYSDTSTFVKSLFEFLIGEVRQWTELARKVLARTAQVDTPDDTQK